MTRGLQLAASTETPAVGVTQTVATHATMETLVVEVDDNITKLVAGLSSRQFVCGRPGRAHMEAKGQSSQRGLWSGRAMIGNPHEALERMALVDYRSQAAEEPWVAVSDMGEDAELPQA